VLAARDAMPYADATGTYVPLNEAGAMAPEPEVETTTTAFASEIGRQVRRARRELDLDQATTALLAGVSERFLREVEHGKDTVQLRQLVAVLDVLGLELRLAIRDA
jgi:HTH-type transcriptional regulator / antitoxin HipB